MIYTILYGFTIGAILYFISIGLSLTFGTIRVINFAHTLTYTIGVYMLLTFIGYFKGGFFIAGSLAVLVVIPISYLIERFIIRRLYGESLDYTFLATFAVSLIGVDTIKWIWGVNPYPLSDPIGTYLAIWGLTFPLYRVLIVLIAILLFFALELFFKRTIVGKIVVAALEDKDGVRCLGVNVDRYFSIVFILGSALAALGGVLYAPISSIHPYMGLSVLLLAFAVVIVGGMGSLRGTFFAAFALGMVMAITARYWSQGAETMVFIVMAIVLIFRPIDI
ncbi:MAG: branched-chain amino acid ABC transporter permease [Deltaproteobacteria bacterium]|jgi:branched-subunit amino acid ABC-type transport system permease component|nr:branched-chain amino acid ABC transporter permease [Deltaproteobacteria bacterium]